MSGGAMKYLYNSIEPFSLDGTELFAEIKADGRFLYVSLELAYGSGYLFGSVRYNGVSEDFYISGTSGSTLVFDYSDVTKTAVISSYGESYTCSWRGSLNDPDPQVMVGYTGVRINDNILTTFDYSTSPSRYNALLAPKMYFKRIGDSGWTLMSYSASKITAQSYSKHIFGGNPAGTLYKYVLLFAAYRNSGDLMENHIGLTEVELPVFTLTDEGTPLAPCGLTYESGHSGQPLRVSWNAVNDPDYSIDGYVVTRCVDGSAYSEVYRGASPSFDDIPPATAHTVSYSVCSFSDGVESAYCDGEVVPLITSNIYVGSGGVRPACAVFIGRNGNPVQAGAVAHVGR